MVKAFEISPTQSHTSLVQDFVERFTKKIYLASLHFALEIAI